jgi:predicted nucleic acid-binding protein
MTQNMNEVLTQATKKIAGIIQKTMAKTADKMMKKGGMPMSELETLIRETDME